MSQTIVCQDGCSPGRTRIGTAASTLKWTFSPPGDGAILNVTGPPGSVFKNGRQDGQDYLVDYQGASPNQDWNYRLTSNPRCPTKAEQAQLTSGPG